MADDYEKRKKKQISYMRAILDYGMGIAIVGLGLFFFFRNKFDMSFNAVYPPNNMDKIFGAICIAYGGWRIYRGYKKNYFK
ncbi:MAG TPA: hypothetical protein VK644_15240 [Chitinophagaceae bacterium]|nr:hypothetical protein [Chitinophagaceae bacterium]